MAYTYDDLKAMTLAQLRDVARTLESPAVQGYTQMNKEHLLPAICAALGVDTHHHHHTPATLAIQAAFDRGAAKLRLRSLKNAREEAIAAHDSAQLHTIRREMHTLKHRLRRQAV